MQRMHAHAGFSIIFGIDVQSLHLLGLNHGPEFARPSCVAAPHRQQGRVFEWLIFCPAPPAGTCSQLITNYLRCFTRRLYLHVFFH